MELDKNQVREVIAKRVALELKDGDVVNPASVYPRWYPTISSQTCM